MPENFAIPVLYGLTGFFFAFLLSRAINIAIIAAFVSVTYRLLENLHVKVEMKGVSKLSQLLQETGKAFLSVSIGIIDSANTTALILFVAGGFAGLLISYSRR